MRTYAANGRVYASDIADLALEASEHREHRDLVVLAEAARLIDEGKRFTLDAFRWLVMYMRDDSPHVRAVYVYAYMHLSPHDWKRLKESVRVNSPMRALVQDETLRVTAVKARSGAVVYDVKTNLLGELVPIVGFSQCIEEALDRLRDAEQSTA